MFHARELTMHNILVGTDGSAGANRAIDIASELARATRGTLTIVAVGAPLLAKETERELLEEELSEAEEQARRTGLKPKSIKTKLLWGDPTEALIEASRRKKADAIVVGRRGHGRLAGLLLGSIAQKLVSLAPCAVVVVG
jgi:nucleotide-binding universal stress UspA family protein